ncbi:hypothetical protein CLV86_2043 [Lacinutrix venerupis]|uniref:hypothetical protein n=1 Tax=Lacinutrix venerupis TaxID=1486034 RepID=UPI000EB39ED7|nr:hypothetical protein [Lacinutrix venerupis]RLJ62438.1 hypothetical protein CLV86_2043 [Lacinutrix venerupis]
MQNLETYFETHPKLVRIVQYILIGLFVVLIIFDIILAATNNITISEVIKGETEKAFFVLTYFWGAVAINLFFTRKSKKLVHEVTGTIILFSIAALIYFLKIGPFLIETVAKIPNQPTQNEIRIAHAISMAFGLLIGYLFWRQDHVE